MGERTTRSTAAERDGSGDSARALVSAITGAPAILRTRRLDLIAANPLARSLYEPVMSRSRTPNLARFVYLAPERARSFFPDWERLCDECVHLLRSAAEHDPHDRALHRLIGELSTRSATFRDRWSARRTSGVRLPRERLRHPVVGELILLREELTPARDPGTTLTVYLPSEDRATRERFAILASWVQPDRCAGAHGG